MGIKNILFSIVLALAIISCSGDGSTDGDTLFAKGKYNEAIEAYNGYLGSNSSDVKTLYNRGRAYQEIGKLDLAEEDFMSVIKSEEKNVNARLSLSKLYYGQELYNKAVLWAEQALEINESSSQAHFLTARGKHQLGYVEGAMESYTSAIKLNPDFGEAYLYRGALKIHLNKKQSACEDFRKAQVLDIKEAASIISKYCN